MERRRFLALGGVVAGGGIVTSTVTGRDGETPQPAQQEQLSSDDRQQLAGSDGVDIETIEELASDSPESLSDEQVEALLSAHEDHTACPLCQGFRIGGISPGSP